MLSTDGAEAILRLHEPSSDAAARVVRDALVQEDDSVGGGGVGGTSGDTGALAVLSTDGAEVQRVRQGIWDTTGNSEDILKMTSTVGDVWMPFVEPLHVGPAPPPPTQQPLGALRAVQSLGGHSGSVQALAWDSGSRTLFSGSGDNSVKVWREADD